MRKNKLAWIVGGIVLFIGAYLLVPLLAYILFAVALLFFGLYYSSLHEHGGPERMEHTVHFFRSEMDAQFWLTHEFVPEVKAYLLHHMVKVISLSFSIFTFFLIIWVQMFFGAYIAAATLLVCILALLYFLFAYWIIRLLSRKAHRLDTEWVRGYFFIVPPVAFFSLLYVTVYSKVVHSLKLLDILRSVFYYSFGYIVLCVIIYFYHQLMKDHHAHIAKAVTDALTDDSEKL